MADTLTITVPRHEDCTFSVTAKQDDMPVRGNASAIDDETDRIVEDGILDRLDRGDVWAWADVTVACRVPGWQLVGHAYLGGCSYADREDFCAPGGYCDDLKREAYADFIRTLEALQRMTA